MSDPRDLFARYLRQHEPLGVRPVVLPAGASPARSRAGTADPEPPGSEERPAAAESPRDGDVPRTRRAARGGRNSEAPAIPPKGLVVDAPASDLFTADPLASMDLDRVADTVRACTICPLHERRTNAVPGEGPPDADLVVVGEGPGANEDAQGRPFVGRAGDLLTDILNAIDRPRDTVYIANIVKCRPPNNRKPQSEEIASCVPYLHRQLEIIRPKVILAMGGTAAETLLNVRASLSSLRNKVHEYRGIPLIVTYHPAALLRNPHWKRPTWDDVRIARQLLER